MNVVTASGWRGWSGPASAPSGLEAMKMERRAEPLGTQLTPGTSFARLYLYFFGSTIEAKAVDVPGGAKLATSSTMAFHSGVAAIALKTSGLSNHNSVTI